MKLNSPDLTDHFKLTIGERGLHNAIDLLLGSMLDAVDEQEFWDENGWSMMDVLLEQDPALHETKVRTYLNLFCAKSPAREVLMALMDYMIHLKGMVESGRLENIEVDVIASLACGSASALERSSEKVRQSMGTAIAEKLSNLLGLVDEKISGGASELLFKLVSIVVKDDINAGFRLGCLIASSTISSEHVTNEFLFHKDLADKFIDQLEVFDGSLVAALWFYRCLSGNHLSEPAQNRINARHVEYTAAAIEIFFRNPNQSECGQKALDLLDKPYYRHLESYQLSEAHLLNPFFVRIKNAAIFFMSHSSDPKLRLKTFNGLDKLISLWPMRCQLMIILHSFKEAPFVNFKTACIEYLKRRRFSEEFTAMQDMHIWPLVLDFNVVSPTFPGVETYHMQLLNFIITMTQEGKLSGSSRHHFDRYLIELDKWSAESLDANEKFRIDFLRGFVGE